MFILFDVGGTKTRVTYSLDGQTIAEPVVEKTVHHSTDGPHHLISLIEKVAAGRHIASITGGIAGTLNAPQTALSRSPNLSEWESYPIQSTLSSHFQCPVHLENDSALVGLGEAHYGAGKDHDIVAYITVSTGVGGVRIVHGKIDINRFGFEPGHHIMDWETKTTLESLVSGSANEERYQRNILELPPETWPKLAQQLAMGIYNASLFWSPDCIVLGGSMIVKEIGIDTQTVIEAYQTLPTVFNPGPAIVEATLEDFGGLYGALAQAKFT